MQHLRPFLFRLLYTAAASLFFLHTTSAAVNEDELIVTLEPKGGVSDEGHVKIVWDTPGKKTLGMVEVEVQQASDADFTAAKEIYKGPDNAAIVSGLPNGTYYYRVRKLNGTWSKPVSIQVKHHPLQLAIAFFAVGAVVFLLTVFIVVKGAMNPSTDD